MPSKKIIRFFIEAFFLGLGLTYLFTILSQNKEDFIKASQNLPWSTSLISIFILFSQTLLVFFAFIYIAKKEHKDLLQNRGCTFFTAFALSSLGKYVPGKIWSFLAFYNIGKKMGLSLTFLSSTFLINLSMGVMTALTLCFVKILPHELHLPSALFLFTFGFLFWDTCLLSLKKLPFEKLKSLSFPKCARVFWSIQWASAILIGLAYELVHQHFQSPYTFEWGQLPNYYISYMAGYVTFFVPAGIGVRESVLIALSQDSHTATTLFLRVLTTLNDLLLAIPALWFYFTQKTD